MDKAKKWVADHKKFISQAEIKDEMDYLILMIDEAGIAEETRPLANKLIKRISGGDIPVEIQAELPDIEALGIIFDISKQKFGGK